ncbi:MAG: prephenate dehydratase [Lachnospiraceae bacterium]
MKNLEEIRVELDEIDREIVSLYEKRMELSKDVARYKISTGKPVFDKERELEKINKVMNLATSEFNKKGIKELFEQIMAISRKLQYGMISNENGGKDTFFTSIREIKEGVLRVVYQGAEGSYSHEAMKSYFGDQVDSFHVETFRNAMEVLKEQKADYAILPIENSTAGIVSEIYDLLEEFDNYIVGEEILQIKHCLLGVEGTKIEDIETVFSHPQSLMQCSTFLGGHSEWKQISMQNNAFAAKKVKEDGQINQAAIASKQAAMLYGLNILQEEINHAKNNSTRFIIVSNKTIFKESANKISICFEIPHASGSLYHILSHFIYNNLNLSKIESRPIIDRNWEYRFFIDFEGNLKESSVENVMQGLKEETTNLKILGNY